MEHNFDNCHNYSCRKKSEHIGYVEGYADCKSEIKEILNRKIEELKNSTNYPHNFKGQMVEDFKWVLSQIK